MLRAIAKNPPLKEDFERWPRPDYCGRVKGKWDLGTYVLRLTAMRSALLAEMPLIATRGGGNRVLQHRTTSSLRTRDPLDLSRHATPASVPNARPQNWIPVYTGMTR